MGEPDRKREAERARTVTERAAGAAFDEALRAAQEALDAVERTARGVLNAAMRQAGEDTARDAGVTDDGCLDEAGRAAGAAAAPAGWHGAIDRDERGWAVTSAEARKALVGTVRFKHFPHDRGLMARGDCVRAVLNSLRRAGIVRLYALAAHDDLNARYAASAGANGRCIIEIHEDLDAE